MNVYNRNLKSLRIEQMEPRVSCINRKLDLVGEYEKNEVIDNLKESILKKVFNNKVLDNKSVEEYNRIVKKYY